MVRFAAMVGHPRCGIRETVAGSFSNGGVLHHLGVLRLNHVMADCVCRAVCRDMRDMIESLSGALIVASGATRCFGGHT